MSGYLTYANLLESRSRGFRDDYSANSLQLSNGVTPAGDVVFSEIGRLAGVSHTDWSWSALFADFDNDGAKDIFIGNGYPKAVNDLDYVNAVLAARRRGSPRDGWSLLDKLPTYAETNYVFRNRGDLTFADESKAWGMGGPSFSYGAAYADLDNDGRLDLVVNNIDAPAFIYHNVQRADDDASLARRPPRRRRAQSPRHRRDARAHRGGKTQYLYQSPYRGFMSTVDDRLHFGLGSATRVDSLEILWPDGRQQVLTALGVDRMLVVKQSDARRRTASPPRGLTASPSQRAFTPSSLLPYRQTTSNLADYGAQPLLPYMLSRQGPPLAVADVNGDGLDDVFVGGGNGVPGKLFLQQANGRFAESRAGPALRRRRGIRGLGRGLLRRER